MSNLFVAGVGVWMTGFGVTKLPGGALGGAIAMVIGGILVLVGLLVH